MLNLWSSRKVSACDGTTRRDFLKVGALGMGGLMLPDLLRAAPRPPRPASPPRNTSVVWLWLGGGPTHVETFDPKMSAPAEFRSTVGAVKTNVPGVELGGVFPKMAQRRRQDGLRPLLRPPQLRPRRRHPLGHDRLRLPARRQRPGARSSPASARSWPAIAAPTTPAPACRPTSAWAASSATARPGSAPPTPRSTSAGNARSNMNLPGHARPPRRPPRPAHAFDTLDRDVDRTRPDDRPGQLRDAGVRPAPEPGPRGVRRQPRRPAHAATCYGNDGLGEQMLLARRLCEAGVGFVTIHFGGWDMHGQIAQGMQQPRPAGRSRRRRLRRGPARPRPGQDDILLVITGEFGRTPRINGSAGRDHWAPLSHAGPGRRRAEDGPGRRRIERQGRGAARRRRSRRRT